jgi:hypothetical protein
MKRCYACKQIKELSEFYKDKSRCDGHKADCKECSTAKVYKWRLDNPNQYKTHLSKYYVSESGNYRLNLRKSYQRRRDKILTQKQEYYARNKKTFLQRNAKRRAAYIQRTPEWLTEDDFWIIDEIYDLAIKRSELFGFKWHVDHIIPLQGKTVSGLHVPLNLQVIPAAENHRKGNRYNG